MRLILLLAIALTGQAADPHPRILLGPGSPTSLPDASASNPHWVSLQAHCDGYLPGVVYPPKTEQGRYDYKAPGGDYDHANTKNPNIGLGYQGGAFGGFNAYWDSIMNLGVCYHTILASNPSQAAKYAAKAIEIIKIISVAPGEAQVLTGKKAGLKRYIYDSAFVKGTAWASSAIAVNGAVAAASTTIPIRGLIPNGTIKAGDAFYTGGQVYLVRADTAADGTGAATVTLGTIHPSGSVNTNESVPAALADGTAVTTPLVVESGQHNLATGDQVQISGILGNTNANGTWTITVIDNFLFILNGAPAGNALQTNLPQDSLLNQGYGDRFFGVAISIGYDWFYDAISPDLRAALKAAAIRWVREAERNGYGQAHPAGNYYAGQFIAKLFAALALEGDDPEGDALWDSWYNNEWVATARTYTVADTPKTCPSGDCPGVQKYFNTYLVDSAHPDGPNYAWLATQNYLWAVMAVHAAKGIDLTTTPAPGFSWGLGAAKAMIHQTWPNRTTFNTRQKLFAGDDPARINADAVYTVSGYLRRYHPDFAPQFQSYANDVIKALKPISPYSIRAPFGLLDWNEFLYWNPEQAPATDYRAQPLSFYSAGSGELAMRSDWTTSAVWASLIAGPNVHDVEGSKDSKDRGSLAITRGGAGFLVNASYELYKAGQVNYADDKTLGEGVPEVTNTFQVNSGQRWRQGYYGPGAIQDCMKPNRSTVSRHSDESAFVYARASYLEDNFYPVGYYTAYPGQSTYCGGTKPLTSWTRDVFYVRPELFLVYDQTEGVSTGNDQFIAWHFPKGVSPVSTGAGPIRYDVSNSTHQFLGAVVSLLPENQSVSVIDPGSLNVVDRLEIRPPAPAGSSQRWLTALDAASSSGDVHALQLLKGQNVEGVEIPDLAMVVTFVRNGMADAPLSYTPQTQNAYHYVLGVTPYADYVVNGQALHSGADGVLQFSAGADPVTINRQDDPPRNSGRGSGATSPAVPGPPSGTKPIPRK